MKWCDIDRDTDHEPKEDNKIIEDHKEFNVEQNTLISYSVQEWNDINEILAVVKIEIKDAVKYVKRQSSFQTQCCSWYRCGHRRIWVR